jgi:hypothetical protein
MRAFGLLALIVIVSLALAAAPPTSSNKPAPTAKLAAPPIVSIKKTDGSNLRGKLLDADGIHLTIQPAVDKNTFGDPVEVPWKDVKVVSTGLTQKKAQDTWKLAHKDELCDACHGERLVTCDVCKGTGHDPDSSKDCKTCKGAQQIACNHPKCDHGKIPCPGPCLKLSEGSWTMHDGKRIRTFRNPGGGTAWVSEGHVGQIVKFDKRGDMTLEDCPICHKTGKIDCPTCHGTGFMPCPTCKADKNAAKCTACEDGLKPCSACAGTGLKGGAAAAGQAGVVSPQAPVAGQPEQPKPAVPKPPGKTSTGDGLD